MPRGNVGNGALTKAFAFAGECPRHLSPPKLWAEGLLNLRVHPKGWCGDVQAMQVRFLLAVDYTGLAPLPGLSMGQTVNRNWLGRGKNKVENVCSWTSDAQPGTLWKAC